MPLKPAKELVVAERDAAPEDRRVEEFMSRAGSQIEKSAAHGNREMEFEMGRGYPDPDIAERVWRAFLTAGYEVAPHPQGGKIIRW